MNVLVVDRDPVMLTAIVNTVRELGHRPSVATSEADVKDAGSKPDVAIVNLSIPNAEMVSVITHLRAIRTTPPVYIIGVATATTDDQLHTAYEAGLDIDLRGAMTNASLRARFRPAERIPRTAPAPATGHALTMQKVPTMGPIELVSRSTAWKTLQGELIKAASTFLTMNVSVGNKPDGDTKLSVVRGIALANVEQQLEIRVAIATDLPSAQALTTHIFGEHTPDLEGDMLGEIANISMGSIKSAFSRDSIAFTGGLPEDVAPDKFYEFGGACQHMEMFVLQVQGARLQFRVGIAAKQNQQVTVMNLREGMVLASDVFNAKGMLMVRAGTRLSSTAAERLRQSLALTQSVDVAAG